MALVAFVGLTSLAAIAGPAAANPAPQYYLALGDSLARGRMLTLGVDSGQGYVDLLYPALLAKNPGLQLVNLACAGETSTTMLNGGHCTTYPEGSQQAAAEAFLRSHPGQVKYITLDIGANDTDTCVTGGSVDVACGLNGLGTAVGNLPKVLAGLRAAGGYTPTIVGMTYYDPFLASWLSGSSGHTSAMLSVAEVAAMNLGQNVVYQRYGAAVADLAPAFHTNDFTTQAPLAGYGNVPLNVATVCTLTWMCSNGNIHANAAGYRVIAGVFAPKLGVTLVS